MVLLTNTLKRVEKLRELKMAYEYVEMGRVDHGPVITASLPSVYEFFAKHSKPATHRFG